MKQPERRNNENKSRKERKGKISHRWAGMHERLQRKKDSETTKTIAILGVDSSRSSWMMSELAKAQKHIAKTAERKAKFERNSTRQNKKRGGKKGFTTVG